MSKRKHRRPGAARASARSNGRPATQLAPIQSQALAVAEQAIERAQGEGDTLSRQPRFQPTARPDAFYSNVQRWIAQADLIGYPYSPDSRARDSWLSEFWLLEPHLSGVLNQVVALDKNRGWSVTGGRNQVYRITDMLHNAEAAPGLYGWRNFFSAQSLSHYTADINAITECGRDGEGGPLRAIYHTDPTRCRLTGIPIEPLEYWPAQGGAMGTLGGGLAGQRWPYGSFFRVASMPSANEAYFGLGYCAVSRALELARLMVAVFRKDNEMLGARMPEGLLLLQGIQQSQWDTAMADREAQLTAKERQYFGGVFVLATAGIDQVDAKLIALRQLPENFDLKVFVDQLMYAYALTFGYSPREFWPVSSGSLGTATEAETQDDNSTGKGESDFVLNYQEALSDELPESVLFQFDERDAKGDLEVTAILSAKASFIEQMASLESGGKPLLTGEQVARLAADQGLIPEEWLAVEAEIEATDTETRALERMRQAARHDPRVMRALERFPNEPIIRYHYRPGSPRAYTLWESAYDYARRRAWPGATLARHLGRLERAIDRAAARLPAPSAS